MSERKVLNKYFPRDYDPRNIPKAKRPRNRQFNIRTMVPCNMRCNTCGEYIYKGKKFNSRCEVAEGEEYLGLRIMRFYVRCPKCVSEITFKTDPGNQDYILEHGATRNFEAQRTAERLAQEEADREKEEEANNPMKLLENRTKQSQREMDALEQLEDLREQSQKKVGLTTDMLLQLNQEYDRQLKVLQNEEDEKFIRSLFDPVAGRIRRLDSDEEDEPPLPKQARVDKPSELLVNGNENGPKRLPRHTSKSIGSLGGGKATMAGLIKRKVPKKSQDSTQDGLAADTVKTENGIKQEKCCSDSTKAEGESRLVHAETSGSEVKSSSNAQSSTETRSQDHSSGEQVSRTEDKSDERSGQAAQADTKPSVGGLGLLGSYSDSGSSSD